MPRTMREVPILLKGPLMVQALDGTKTSTRRLITQVRGIGRVTEVQPSMTPGYDWTFRDAHKRWHDFRTADLLERCPFGGAGWGLWGRETWRATFDDNGHALVEYRADGCTRWVTPPTQAATDRMNAYWERLSREGAIHHWRPSIFMPREASRFQAGVLETWVEQLQDITQAGARSEGVARITVDSLADAGISSRRIRQTYSSLSARDVHVQGAMTLEEAFDGDLVRAFAFLWDLLAPQGRRWLDNPPVWGMRWVHRDYVPEGEVERV